MYKTAQLKNGLRIITQEMKDRGSVAIGIWVGVGGRYEQDRLRGATHFVEHIVFKGSQKNSCEQIKEKIEGVGGSLNAFTSEEQTCFYAKIPSQHLTQTLGVLTDMVFHPNIKKTDVVKEKTVIIEEIKMYHDLPQYFVMELLDGLLWPNHPLGKQLAGTMESVSGLTAKDLQKFHETYYFPGNVVISACGNLNHESFVNQIKKTLSSVKGNGEITFQPFNEVQSQPRTHFFKKDIEQMHLALGLPGYHEDHPDKYVLTLLSIILGGNMSSRLFVEVREKKGLAYSIGSTHKSMSDTGVFMVRAGVDNVKIVDAVDVILKEFKKIKSKGILPGEFKRAKDYLIGQIQLGLEDTMEHMLWIGESMLSRNKGKTLEQVMSELNKIKISDVERVAQDILQESRYNLALVGPISPEQSKKIETILNI
ncbi:MAG: insulinase family protein [Candidatus Omnitrophica bacterium]|nr:insulinase family protein [Candidatus Omnitrophota bacterium]